jgi:hypothetical protein
MKGSELRFALPFVAAITIVTAMLCAPLLHMFAALPTLLVAVGALLTVRLGKLFPIEEQPRWRTG